MNTFAENHRSAHRTRSFTRTTRKVDRIKSEFSSKRVYQHQEVCRQLHDITQ